MGWMPGASRSIPSPPKATPSMRWLPTSSGRILRQNGQMRVWTGDITYIPTAEGWLYLAVLLDVCSRRVIGWAMSARCDELLVETALRMALARRRPEDGLLHHTDRGSQYTSRAYRQGFEQRYILVRMSGEGNFLHKAVHLTLFWLSKN